MDFFSCVIIVGMIIFIITTLIRLKIIEEKIEEIDDAKYYIKDIEKIFEKYKKSIS